MKYLDSIENKHRVIRIEKAPEYDGEALSIARHLEMYPNTDLTKKIRETVGPVVNTDEYFKRINDRAAEFKSLLMSTWKMCLVNKEGKESAIRYLFPYKYNDTNTYLFYLESIIYTNFYHINGLTESSADVTTDDFWTRQDTIFYEVDFSEMLEHAKKRCDEAAEERLRKIVELNRELIN